MAVSDATEADPQQASNASSDGNEHGPIDNDMMEVLINIKLGVGLENCIRHRIIGDGS